MHHLLPDLVLKLDAREPEMAIEDLLEQALDRLKRSQLEHYIQRFVAGQSIFLKEKDCRVYPQPNRRSPIRESILNKE